MSSKLIYPNEAEDEKTCFVYASNMVEGLTFRLMDDKGLVISFMCHPNYLLKKKAPLMHVLERADELISHLKHHVESYENDPFFGAEYDEMIPYWISEEDGSLLLFSSNGFIVFALYKSIKDFDRNKKPYWCIPLTPEEAKNLLLILESWM